MASISRYFTLDVLSTVAFGRPFGFMSANADLWSYDATVSQFQLALELVVNHASVRWLYGTRLVQWLAAPKVSDKSGIGPVLGFARQAVAERFGPNAKVKRDMLGHFVGKGLSQAQCEAEAFLQIIAGSDSTTTVLRSTMYLVVGTPDAYRKLQAEIRDADQCERISYPVALYDEAQRLPYLNACIFEGLRLYPPLFGLKIKQAPPGGETVNGIYFPEGTEIGLCDDAMCRNPAIFGADAHLFRPDRWLEVDAETKTKYRQIVDTVFGSGRFKCLGRHIAMMELHKALIEVSPGRIY
jgi:cytochrome P450